MRQKWVGAVIIAAIVIMTPETAAGQTEAPRTYNIPRQDLASALKAFAAASDREVVASSDTIAGKRSGTAVGPLAPEQAIERLLVGTGLSFRIVEGAFVVRPMLAADAETALAETDIIVTGSRIRGAPVASPVIRIDQENLRDTGIADVGEAVRRIPQSFGGGQNPGIGLNVPEGSGVDIGGSSSLNLRGLGSDATLTLLNGRRLAYTAVDQSVDVAAIPLEAIERIEIVPDGASAIYGSDAVAGVANIVLRRDFKGIETSARLAGATDGGDFQQRYGVLAGTTWSGGGVFAAYDYDSNSAIHARDRSYAAKRSPGLDLFPALGHHGAIASGHQDLGGGLSFDIDGLYSIRRSELTYPTTPEGDLRQGRDTAFSRDQSFAIAPGLHLDLPADWQVSLVGSIGKERVDTHDLDCTLDECADSGVSFYRNISRSIELNGNGRLFALPGGSAKLALGAGYRSIGFRRFAIGNAALDTSHRQNSHYAFGELSLPLIGPAQALTLVHSLDLSAALRYERYPGIGAVATPKLGLIWGVTPDLDLKASWGRSFRAPTLFQQYQPRAVYLYPPVALGAAGVPATAGALLVLGGNPDLKPERATTWSATIGFHPRSLPGARVEATYFHVDYRDRIVAPITLLREALSNPIYRDRITRDPSLAEQTAIIDSASSFLDITGVPYDPANVIAIVDDGNVNAARQRARGADLLVGYDTAIGDRQKISLSADIAYLKSDQRLSPTQPIVPLAGTIFNPPHWRGQASAGWSTDPLTLTAVVNYIGGVGDTRDGPAVAVRGMTTLDLTARYRVSAAGLHDGLDLTLSVQNVLNQKPDPIAVTIAYDTPYDSTNYSPVGRLIAVGVRTSW